MAATESTPSRRHRAPADEEDVHLAERLSAGECHRLDTIPFL